MVVDQLRTSVRAEDSYTLVTLVGQPDMSGQQILSDALRQAASQPARGLIVDLSELDFIDSATVHILLDAHARLVGDGGQMMLVAPKDIVARVLSLVGADQVLPVLPDVATAVASLG